MSTISASTTSTTAYKVTADTTGALVLQTGATPTTAMTISTGQVVTFAQAPVLPAASIPQAALAAGVAGTGPAFSAYANASQSISSVTFTKITFNAEEFDTASCFDSTTNYRFTPTVAGYYQVNLVVGSNGNASHWAVIYKNGSVFKYSAPSAAAVNVGFGASISVLVYMNGTTDYIEGYTYIAAAATIVNGTGTTYFQASMVRAA